MRNKKKKYYIIYLSLGDRSGSLSKIFTIVESEEVAKDWCNRNREYYYIEKICE